MVEADMVLKAIGQTLVAVGVERELLTLDGSRIAVDANGQTSLAGVWAGGDCAATGGVDLTTATEFLKAGAVCLGVGGQLVDPKAVASGDFARITQTAKQYVEIVRQFRAR